MCRCRLIVRSNVGSADSRGVGNAHWLERSRISGTVTEAGLLGWLALPDGFGRPKARFRSPSFLKTPGEQDPAKTTSALEQLTDSSRTLRQVRKVHNSGHSATA